VTEVGNSRLRLGEVVVARLSIRQPAQSQFHSNA
jgi:hypothetical protein